MRLPLPTALAFAAALAAAGSAAARPPGPDEERPAASSPRLRVVLALSGGGARGFSHIGVLRGFERCGVPVDGIAGTSIGAIVGGLYALGYTTDELEEVATRQNFEDILFQPRPPSELPLSRRANEDWSQLTLELDRRGLSVPSGLVATQRLAERLSLLMLRGAGSTGFDRLRLPFRAIAADLETGKKIVFDSGSLVLALRASSAVPGVFAPVEVGGRLLVDGGILENLPVDEARALGGDIVIAVDTSSPLRERAGLRSFVDVVDQVVGFSMVERLGRAKSNADVVLVPALGDHGTFEFSPAAARDVIACGEEAALQACPAIRRYLGSGAPPPPAEGQAAAPPGRHVQALEVATLDVRGARPATERLLRRHFGRLPADRSLSLGNLEARLRRLRALDEIKRVDLDYSADAARLTIDVTEAPPIAIRLAARHDDKLDTLGRVALIWRPGIGPVRNLTADLIAGRLTQLRLGARHERLLGTPLLAFARAMWMKDFDNVPGTGGERGELDKHHRGLEAGLGWAFGVRGLLTVGYRLERAISEAERGADPALASRAEIGALVARAELDTSDRGAFPSSGTSLSFGGIFARPGLGGDARYTLVDGEAHAWLPLDAGTVGYARGRIAGTLAGELPEVERLVAGGNDSLPGYSRDRFRGETLGIAGLGIRHRFFKVPGALGGGFYVALEGAAGTVSDGRPELSDHGEVLFGAALRASFDTRLGPIELALGMNRHGRVEVSFDAGPRF